TYIIEFFLFSFFGWVIDSAYSSMTAKKFVSSGYFIGFPLCPIYGFGGIILLNSFAYMADRPWWLAVLVTTILVVALEYFGGKFAEHFLEERLWDYSKEKFNIDGYISAWHSFLWLVTVAAAYLLIGNKANLIIEWFNSLIRLNINLEVIITFMILSLAFWLTTINKKARLLRIAKNRLSKMKSIEELIDLEHINNLREEKIRELFSENNIKNFLEKIEVIKKK
ncbi:MAG: putative ABC transporter permease, partial [Ignavibacteria bacterium]|nr:putative ABC transporter permease [Ignavibacteria bacterium]